MRATTANEAAWIIAGYHLNAASHTVERVFAHLPHEEAVMFNEGEEEEACRDVIEDVVSSQLKAWMILNASNSPDAECASFLTFDQMPKFFRYVNGEWIKRKKDYSRHILGTIKSVRPTFTSTYAVRLLCYHKAGVKSFEELRTVDGVVHETFIGAAKVCFLSTFSYIPKNLIDNIIKKSNYSSN